MLEDQLLKKRGAILKRWLDLISDTHYSGSSFLKDADRFTNPVGYIFSSEVEILYDALLQGLTDTRKICDSLQNIIKVRAIQDCTAGQAVSFVFLLKKAIRDSIKNDNQVQQELVELESRIDELAMLAFEEYVISREKLSLIRINEMKRDRDNAIKLLDRTARKYGQTEETIGSGYTTNEVTE